MAVLLKPKQAKTASLFLCGQQGTRILWMKNRKSEAFLNISWKICLAVEINQSFGWPI
jgi:hypothetical protein